MNKNFYCYSHQLMRFLKLQGISYMYYGFHSNGNKYWVFHSTDELNQSLTKWTIYKGIFPAAKEV